ncbi:hypothetical protein JXA63_04395 [Candidatus Woesebacteria bacterium]|nr:hypothetical protein [Candidatus Woesebacteria bacterium]
MDNNQNVNQEQKENFAGVTTGTDRSNFSNKEVVYQSKNNSMNLENEQKIEKIPEISEPEDSYNAGNKSDVVYKISILFLVLSIVGLFIYIFIR